ncbi:hypothetical protein [Deinococcus sp. AJ005]|uniref:hypothetical protein n=1 Tax=Deinococcus sp. AJ005 TaxID=2652443 RepID=UPI00125CB891|nr:hypothetical protein [Deinococcus sp. AJ005]QFP75021.1 hypothetical protein DAAJ005_00195 [Deinococcus sp. AJ005]
MLRLGAAHRSAERLTMDQAALAPEGKDVALAALAGGLDHADRSAAGEARALAATSLFQACPPAVLKNAIASCRCGLRQAAARGVDGLPQCRASHVIAGPGLVRRAGPGTLHIDGVGEVRADLIGMPDWAYDALWLKPAYDESTHVASEEIELVYSGSASLEGCWSEGDWQWKVTLDFAETW